MKLKWFWAVLMGICLCVFAKPAYATVVSRPTLFVEVLKQNEAFSDSAVAFMERYLVDPTPTDLAELRKLFRKMMGDSECSYLSANGFAIEDFLSSLNVIAALPAEQRRALLTDLDQKAYPSAVALLSQYDRTLMTGTEVISLAYSNGKPVAPLNAKIEFERHLKSVYETNSAGKTVQHWSVEHAVWLARMQYIDETQLQNCDPRMPISPMEFLTLMKHCTGQSLALPLKGNTETLTRMEAMQLLDETLKLQDSLKSHSTGGAFTDIENLSEEERNCIEKLAALEIVKGYANGMLKPNHLLSYGEAWTMLRKALD